MGGPGPYWQSFTYDSAGNRKTATDHLADATTSYTYKTPDQPRPHALAATETKKTDGTVTGTTSYTYDLAGNTDIRTLGGKPQDLDFNAEGSLEKVTEADKTATEYLNDADGNRLIRRDTTGTTLYLGETELRLDKASAKVEATRYYSHSGQNVAVRTTAGLTWTAADHNGTASVQVDAATQTVTRRQMKPFGEDRGEAAKAWVGERGFVGGTKEPTGLTHLGAREYDPSTGRFVSVDPVIDLTDPQQVNGYSYSSNNPVTFADPDGKFRASAILLFLARQVGRAIVAAQAVSMRQSGSSSSGGMSTGGSANYASSGSSSCMPPRICGNVEPADPRSVGSWKDLAGGIGDFFAESADVYEMVEPWCWSGTNPDCGGTQDKYQELVEGFGADPDSDVYQGTKTVMDVGSVFAGGFGIGKFALKQLFKKQLRKQSKDRERRREKEASGCTECFLAGTGVQMADGSTKDIEDIEAGDEVLATDPETGETGVRKVTHLIITEDDKHFNELSIATEDGIEKLTATYEHPFWSPSGQDWIEAGDLAPGMSLLTDEGDTVVVTANRAYEDNVRTYNLTVDDLHTYYVLAGETPVLVHNSGPGCGSAWIDSNSIPHHFKHAEDFGIMGKESKATKQAFTDAIGDFVNDPGNVQIAGTYRGTPARHYVDLNSGRHVSVDLDSGKMLGAWKSDPGSDQFWYLTMHGKL